MRKLTAQERWLELERYACDEEISVGILALDAFVRQGGIIGEEILEKEIKNKEVRR